MAHQKDPLDWKIKRYRDGSHIANCQKGYAPGPPFTNTHHILPIGSLADGTIAALLKNNQPHIDFITKCLKKTKWDINGAGNLVRLPMKHVWRNEDPAFPTPGGWDGWPCHQVDHYPKYNSEVDTTLKKNVWDMSIENAKNCNFRSKSLAAALKESAKLTLSELKTLGARNGGTKYCWDNIDAPANQWKPGTTPANWYYPFSMAQSPNTRSPPSKKPSAGMAAFLKKIFTII